MSKLQQRNKYGKGTRTKSKTNSKPRSHAADRGDDYEDTNNKRVPKGKGSNDPSWYGADPSLLRDSASFPYSWPMGTPLRIKNQFIDDNHEINYTIPGLCALYLAPSVGNSDGPTSAVNIASTAMYAFVRHANSGHSNYEAPDLMIYTLAMTQVYAYINFLQRVYGCATLFSHRNRFLPDTLLTSARVDPKSIASNLASFRYGVNVLINRAASLAVPANMTIFSRQAFLYQNVYVEGSSVKDQMYVLNPDGFWWFDIDTAGKLKYVPFTPYSLDEERKPYDLFTYEELLDYGNRMLSEIVGDEDMNIMSGDILKAYGSNILQLQTLPEYYPLLPVYNIGVLEQIQNATVLDQTVSRVLRNSGALDVTQELGIDKSYLKSLPNINITTVDPTVKTDTLAKAVSTIEMYNAVTYMSDKVINTFSSEATPELTMENTRLALAFERDAASTKTNLVMRPICGTEIVMKCCVFRTPGQSEEMDVRDFGVDQSYGTLHSGASIVNGASVLARCSKGSSYADQWIDTSVEALSEANAFRFIPIGLIYTLYLDHTAAPTLTYRGIRGDLSNYTVITTNELRRMHDAALMNELAVPSIAKMRG